MNSQLVPYQYNQECVYQMVYEIIVCLLLLFIRCTIIFYINNKLSKIAKVSERNEGRAQITSKQIDNISELCERLIVQNVGAYDRSAELARDMDTRFDNMTKQISTIPATFDKMLATTICDLVDNISATNKNIEEIQSVRALDNIENKKNIEEIHSVRSLDNIENGLYQCWTGVGVYSEEGKFKITSKIRITNKHLKTYRENKEWFNPLKKNTSIAYRDMLMESISKVNPKYELNGFNIPPDFVKKTYNNYGSQRPYNAYMNCVKYDWNGSIEIDITITEEYNNNNTRPQDAMMAALSNSTIDWMQSLVLEQ
jgi:hypothetical protein